MRPQASVGRIRTATSGDLPAKLLRCEGRAPAVLATARLAWSTLISSACPIAERLVPRVSLPLPWNASLHEGRSYSTVYHRSATPARASDADNQRADLVGCAGNSIIETPNLDLLGYRGVRFANAFATTPVCAASRASYLTGLYERRRRFTFQTPPLRREFSDISYPALLRAAGYHTGFIGKFGIAVNGIEPSLQDAGDLERMFDHFDSYEHWTDEGYCCPPSESSWFRTTPPRGVG